MANPTENVRKFLQEIAEKENYKLAKIDITPVTSEGANYTTILYTATISEQLKLDLQLFVKVANMTENFRAQNPTSAAVFTIEALFYDEMAFQFDRIYKKNNVPDEDRMLIPKYYGHVSTPGDEILVLENLQAKGFLNYERQKPFSWEHASTAVSELAKFHALGLALRDDSPNEFENIISQFGPDLMYADNSIAFFVNGVQRNGKLEIITLDYQTLRMGNPVFDFMYFIVSATDEEFRHTSYQLLLDHYFSQLTLALKKLNIDVEKVYSKKTFENDVKELQIFGLFIGLPLVPIFLVNPADAPEAKGAEDMVSFQVKPNQLAVERINGIVRDFVKWGVI